MVCGGWKKLAGRSIGQCGPLVLQSYVKCRRGPWAQTGRTRLFLGPRGERATSASEGGPCAPGPFCSIARGARKWFVADCAVVMMMPKILHPNCQGQVDYSCILCAAGGKFGGGATGRRTRHATLRDPSPQSAHSRMFAHNLESIRQSAHVFFFFLQVTFRLSCRPASHLLRTILLYHKSLP